MRSIIIIVLSIVVMLLSASCDRNLAVRDPIGPPDEGPTVLNVRAIVDDARLSLSWETTDTSWAKHYRVYLSDSLSGPYLLTDSSTEFSYSSGDLLLGRTYYVQIAPVDAAGMEGLHSAVVSAYISHLSITINQGSPTTNSVDVIVSFNVPDGAISYRLAEDAISMVTPWLAFSPSVPFELSNGDGAKTLVAHLQFGDGTTTGDLLVDEIVLDTKAQIVSLNFTPVDSVLLPGDVINFSMVTNEFGGEAAVTFGSGETVFLLDDGLDPDQTASDGVYYGAFVVPPGYRLAEGRVTGLFTDAVGNIADNAAAGDLLNISSPPTIPNLWANGLSTHQIRLSWDRSSAIDFLDYLLYRSTSPEVSLASTLVAAIQTDSITMHIDSALTDNTVYYYRLYVQNTFSQQSSSAVVSAGTFQNSAPESVTLAAGLEGENTARLTWTVSVEDDFASYELFWSSSPGVSTSDDRLAIVSDRNELSVTHYVPASSTRHYRIFVRDRHGLLSSASNEVSVTAP